MKTRVSLKYFVSYCSLLITRKRSLPTIKHSKFTSSKPHAKYTPDTYSCLNSHSLWKKCLSVSNLLKHATLHCHSSSFNQLLTPAYVNFSPGRPHSLSHTQHIPPLTLCHLNKIATHPVFARINMDPNTILSVTKNVPRNLFCIHTSMPCP